MLVLFLAWPAAAQFTQVQGTVVDPHGVPYSNGTIFPTLVISGSPRFTSSGFPYVPPSQATALDARGAFVMSIADVTQLTPSGGLWTFTVNCGQGCIPPAAGAGPVTFTTVGLIISGTVQDISAVLDAAAPPLTGGGGGGGGVTSINGGTGAFNFAGNAVACAGASCTFTDTNGTGAGTSGQFALYDGGNTVFGTPSWTFGASSVVNVANSLNATQPITFGPTQGLLCTGATTIIPTSGNPNPGQFGCLSIGSPAIQYTGNGGVMRPITVVKTNGAYFTSNEVNFNGTSANPPVCNPAAPTNGRCVSFSINGGQISAALVGDGTPTNCYNGTGNFVPCDSGITCILQNDVNFTSTPGIICSQALQAKPYTIKCVMPLGVNTGTGTALLQTFINSSAAPFQSNTFMAWLWENQAPNVTEGVVSSSGQNFIIGQNINFADQLSVVYDGVIFLNTPSTVSISATIGSGSMFFQHGSYCRFQP